MVLHTHSSSNQWGCLPVLIKLYLSGAQLLAFLFTRVGYDYRDTGLLPIKVDHIITSLDSWKYDESVPSSYKLSMGSFLPADASGMNQRLI